MAEKVLIFGKDTWPYTTKAREAFAKENRELAYFNIVSDIDELNTMLKYSGGIRKVPIIVDGSNVTVGYKGRTWEV